MKTKIAIVFFIAIIVIACTIIGNYLYAIGETKGAIAYLLMAIGSAFFQHHVITEYQTKRK
jgi:hypothetical protein